MCVTCGCSDNSQVTVTSLENDKTSHSHTHTLADGTVITHTHQHDHSHVHNKLNSQNDKTSHSHTHTHSSSQTSEIHARMHGTTVTLEQEILRKNDRIAEQNRHWFQERGILALNLVSSPGAGKTTLLTRTINDLKSQLPISVIEGDQETVNDAEKIRQTGCQVVQINTGTGCHLEAAMVQRGYLELNPPSNSILAIENVGNLVCPALFDLGEKAKVAILSVTEGEDKPIKYPHMFRASQVIILTKIDLLPYVQFDVNRCLEYARQVNPHILIFQVSAITGAGLNDWYEWLQNQRI
ncbi:MAG: hydrogenase nickel incorporation protein HypB [Xenococcaceae cyanobacterium MO_207.B15]|nr:hydrogenase nickel incorporation protein HypB [Xenococcaceae cyanobacterium MO_207.B15]